LDGYDYIDGEYIKPYLDPPSYSYKLSNFRSYKAKITMFREGISPYDATKPENLAWTKRVIIVKKSQTKLEK
jgi:hypothetical protein